MDGSPIVERSQLQSQIAVETRHPKRLTALATEDLR
jgi:hypothetical protein